MKCLKRNKVKFYYAKYIGKEELRDEYGNLTGEYSTKHSNPIECYANISAAKGEINTRQFGENDSYDKVITLADDIGIDEFTILWVDTIPLTDANGVLSVDSKGEVITSHDYIVKKVAKSLNHINIAISKVNVDG